MKFHSNDNAFTGLEAAIVLIAFVVVAAVFSYVVLGAGFFTTQKSQEVVHSGVQQASSTLQIFGNVYGIGTPGTSVNTVNFTVGLAPGGSPIDFDKVAITYSNSTTLETLSHVTTKGAAIAGGQWVIFSVQNQVTDDNVLEKGEQFEISAMPSKAIIKDDHFSLEIKPAIGAALSIVRDAPASIQGVNILY
ncbi:flagellin [uncultured Methanoregula sp.]|uniref:flagellin n=1 Tax=uncultured Methanoregula sp. TaxID=1005933 RepID=UPI002AAABEF4|nr:flagellin [uncultured Methanoregula sp.]